MSGGRVPEEIPELGPIHERLRQNPAVKPEMLTLTAQEGFVMSRLDGHTSLRELILMIGLPADETVAILQRLRKLGALLREGELPELVAARTARARDAAQARPAAPGGRTSQPGKAPAQPDKAPAQATARSQPRTDQAQGTPELDDAALDAEERAAMAEDNDLGERERRRILTMRRQVGRVDYFTLLGVPQDVSKRDLQRSYFRLSKEFHPDIYYGKNTGSFGPWLALVFETLSKGFETLRDAKSRERYQGTLSGREQGSQSRPEYAAELFDNACTAEARGELQHALTLFAAAVRVDAQPRHLSRAARCALAAGDIPQAQEYAQEAVRLEPRNASFARVLAEAYRAADKLGEARDTLVAALAGNPENDALVAEIEADLETIRALIDQRGGRRSG